MSTDIATACAQAEQAGATALENLTRIEGTLRGVQKEVAGLPFFVRGFVTSEVKRGTGQDIPAWIEAAGQLSALIGQTQATLDRVRTAGTVDGADRAQLAQTTQRLEAERPGLEKLAEFMEQAPSKVNAVPAGILPPARRDEFLGAVQQQAQSLRTLLSALTALTHSLHAVGEAA